MHTLLLFASQDGVQFTSAAQSALASESHEALARSISERVPLWLPKSAEADAEGALTILCHIVARLAPGPQAALAASLAQSITSASPTVDTTLKGLTELFNCCEPGTGRLSAMLELCRAASAAGASTADQAAAMVSGRCASWVASWRLSPSEARQLELAIASVLLAAGRSAAREAEALQLLTRALASLEGEPEATQARHKVDAARALSLFLRSDSAFQCDALQLKAVLQLAKDAKTADLLQAAQLMLAGDAKGFETFAKSKPGVFAEVGTTVEAALDKARFMAILAACAPAAYGGAVGYDVIAKALGVSVDAVEPWIARAIGLKLLEGRLDQVNDAVVVKRAGHRTFSEKNWGELRGKLQQLRGAVQVVVQQAQGTA